ncbi:MAG: hypothetical protein ACFFCW_50135 [Candidatus Hodarchaeota archaeon]
MKIIAILLMASFLFTSCCLHRTKPTGYHETRAFQECPKCGGQLVETYKHKPPEGKKDFREWSDKEKQEWREWHEEWKKTGDCGKRCEKCGTCWRLCNYCIQWFESEQGLRGLWGNCESEECQQKKRLDDICWAITIPFLIPLIILTGLFF